MAVLSRRAPGQPAANGLGPDTTRSSCTAYGPTVRAPAPATADPGALTSSTLASSAAPARKTLDLIAHLPGQHSHQEAAASLRSALRGSPHPDRQVERSARLLACGGQAALLPRPVPGDATSLRRRRAGRSRWRTTP